LSFTWENLKFWLKNQMVRTIPFGNPQKIWAVISGDNIFHSQFTGAPNENIVQKHLNVALLNVF